MISEKSIREEKFNAARTFIGRVLYEIPMTGQQRHDIDDYLDEMEDLFRVANK